MKPRKVSGSTVTEYIDGIQYNGTTIDFVQTEEGRAFNSGGTYKYEYTLTDHLGNKNWVDWYGAYDIDPQYLVFWICVMSDDMKQKLKSDAELNAILKNIPSKHGYPTKVKNIDFESQETVYRESNGNWYQHFK